MMTNYTLTRPIPSANEYICNKNRYDMILEELCDVWDREKGTELFHKTIYGEVYRVAKILYTTNGEQFQ